MASKDSLNKVFTFRVKQLNECHQKLQASLGAYVGQITGCAQAWIEKSEDLEQDKFVDITVQLDEAMIILLEMTSNVENNLTGIPSGAGTAIQSTADSPAQINAASPGLDASIRSLLERLDALHNVTDMVQELQTDLDACKTQMDSVEGMRESLENITSHCGMLTRAQVESRFEQFEASQLTQILHFEKELSQMQASLSKTDSEMKDVANSVNVLSEQCADRIRTLTEPEDELPAVEISAQIEYQHQDNSLSDLDGQLCHLETVTDTIDDGMRGIEEELAELKTKKGPTGEEMEGQSGSIDPCVLLATVGLELYLVKEDIFGLHQPSPPEEITCREEEMTRTHEEMTHTHEEMTCKLDEMTRKLDEMTHTHEEMTHTHEEMTHTHEEMTHTHEEMTHTHEEMTHTHEEMTHTHEEMTPRLEKMTPRLEKMTHRLERMTHRLEEMTPRLERMTHRLERMTHRLERMTHRLERMTHRLERMTHRLERMTRRQEAITCGEEMTHRQEAMTMVEEAMTMVEEAMTRRQEEITFRDVASPQMDSVVSSVSSQPPAAKVTEPAVTSWTGFCVQCMDDIKTVSWSTSFRWKVLSRGTSCGFDVRDIVFTAPVGGLYLMIFVHYQTGTKPTTIRLILSEKSRRREKAMITTNTTSHNEYDIGHRYVSMKAGETFYLSLPTKHCSFQIPFFSCVLVS